MSGIDELRRRYPWPGEMPDIPVNLDGWFSGDNQKTLASLLTPKTQVVIELGSWYGKSATFIAQHAPNAAVLCIDHWKGSAEHHRRPDWQVKLAGLYEGFIRNLWQYRDRVVPMKTTTLEGMAEIHQLGIVPQVIYVDASHDEESVYDDTITALKLFPTAEILGDDWLHDSVRRGVVRAAHRLWLRVHGVNCWQIPLNKRDEVVQ